MEYSIKIAMSQKGINEIVKEAINKSRENSIIEIVSNKCYGGFGLSDEATKMLVELKGLNYETLSKRDRYYIVAYLPRTDKDLITVVKTLKEKANGFASELCIQRFNLDDYISFEDHDGYERLKVGRCEL